jgi:hypothetical protein
MLRGRAVATLVDCSQRVVLCYDMLHYGAVLQRAAACGLASIFSPRSRTWSIVLT